MIENLKDLKEALKNGKENLEKEASNCTDINSVVALFKEKGVEISEVCAEMVLNLKNKRKSISEDELAAVTGGGVVNVYDDICPNCGGVSGYTKEGQPIIKRMVRGDGDFDCNGRFYWEYECPVCGEDYDHYVNDGFWVD